jgi:hypothetical protein
MTIRAAVTTGTLASFAVTIVWAGTATLTIGTPPVLHLSLRDPLRDYMQLADAATGSNGLVLFAVLAAIFALCFFLSGLRARRKAQRQASRDLEDTEDTDAAISGRWR